MNNPDDRTALEAAVTEWAAAIDAVHRDIDRLARGGTARPDVTAALLADVDLARRRCEAELSHDDA